MISIVRKVGKTAIRVVGDAAAVVCEGSEKMVGGKSSTRKNVRVYKQQLKKSIVEDNNAK